MITTLDDKQLSEMVADLRRWSANPAHLDDFRQQCATCAALIDNHLAGADNQAEAAAAIEQVYGDLAHREAERLERMGNLHEATDAAYQRGDLAAWKASFVQLLDTLSESHLEFLAGHFASLTDPQPATVIDLAMLQPMPAGIQ